MKVESVIVVRKKSRSGRSKVSSFSADASRSRRGLSALATGDPRDTGSFDPRPASRSRGDLWVDASGATRDLVLPGDVRPRSLSRYDLPKVDSYCFSSCRFRGAALAGDATGRRRADSFLGFLSSDLRSFLCDDFDLFSFLCDDDLDLFRFFLRDDDRSFS